MLEQTNCKALGWMCRYEEDVRLPLLVRPPAALKGSVIGAVKNELVLAIDVAPTFLQLAGLNVPPAMDGRSWLPLLVVPPAPPSVFSTPAPEQQENGYDADRRSPWRSDALIEYWGEAFGPYGQSDNAFTHPPLYKGPAFR